MSSISWTSLVILFLTSSVPVVLPQENQEGGERGQSLPFGFTSSVYNASVPENSMGSTLVLPTEKMGVWNPGERGRVKLEIVQGDPLKLFRVEEKQVGIFCFLILRVNNNERSLNREYKDVYKLRVKATLFQQQVPERTPPPLPPQRKDKGPSSSVLPIHTSEAHNVVDVGESGDGGGGGKSRLREDPGTSRTLVLQRKVRRAVGSGGELTGNDQTGSGGSSSGDRRRSEISRLHHYLDLTSPATTERETFLLLDPQSWSTYGRNETWREGSRNPKSSKVKNPPMAAGAGRRAGKALLRNSRDERRTKARNKTKSGEKRKNRKEKQIVNPLESNVPIPITLQTTTTTTTTTTATVTPKPNNNNKPLTKIMIPPPPPPPEELKLVPIAVAECTIYIQILDQPDNGPLFEQRTYDMSVLEDIPVLSKIAKIVAVDADIGRNQEIYYSLAEWNSHFAVDPILGILSPTRSLVGMVGKRQHIRIQARNRWSPGPAAESTSIVSIRPANRHTPQILINRPPQVETRPYGVIYAVVSCRDNDEGPSGLVDVTIKEGDPNGIFRVLPASSRNEFYVVMSPVVAKSLNSKGQASRPNTFNLTLRAEDGGQPSKTAEKELQLKVSEFPGSGRGSLLSSTLFDKDLYEVEISESSPPQTLVFRFPRPDPKVTLSISSGNEGEEFRLERSGVLYTSKWLDFERKSIFTLTVDSLDLRPAARYDQIRRQRSAVKIVIKLIDENKFWPIFDPPGNKDAFFAENEPVGTLVTRVHAKDSDQGENGYVTYSMANLNNLPFSIDHFTGEVRSLEVLDYETSRRVYVARVRATDWGLPFRRESEMKLQISLIPINDNRPLFIYSNCVSVIDRRISFETEFGRVVALDFDHDLVTYKIVHGNSDSCFSIDSSGSLRVMCDLRDYRNSKRVLNLTAGDGEYFSDVMSIKIELRDSLRTNFNKSEPTRLGIKLYSTSHSVFECQDTGVQERYDRMAALSEENNKVDETGMDEELRFPAVPSHYTENTQPQFLDFPNEIRVNESIPVGTRVVKLKGVDRDKGYNAFLKFVISSGDESHGAWDIISVETTSWTGATVQEAFLVVARPLDREEFSSYTLNISVFDQGKPPRSMSKLLPIKILDENDNAPQFLKSAMKIRIREGNELVGETIAQVKADDEDEEGSPNGMISYRLVNETFHNFSIDGKSGKVRLLGELDRERVDRYEILIVAEDAGQPKQSSMAVLTIIVEDRNDESPRFLNVGKNRVVRVREDWPLYSVVTRVVAEDPDLGDGGQVRYALLDGGRGDFLLDEVSGVLRVNRKLDYQRTSMYNLTVQAKDLGTPSHSAETYLVVEIYDVQESQPRLLFPDLVTVASIREGAPVGSLVTQIAPISLPQLGYPGVYFSLEGTSQFLFTIDSTGSVRTFYEMDYETQAHWHYLTVVAQSSLDMTNIAHCFLVIQLQNENDCVPLTTEPMYLASVEENLNPGTPVLRLQGFDCDNSPSELQYSLSRPSSLFEIDLVSGQILTTAVLDREEFSEHTLDIIISDTSFPPLSSSTKVKVSVGDGNDHVPRVLQFSSGSVYDIPELKSETTREEQDDEPIGGGGGDENLVVPEENEETEYELKWSDWRMMDVGEEMAMAEGWRKIFRVVGYDPDAGVNGSIQYRLKYRVNTGAELQREDEVYSIHPSSGEIYTSAAGLKSDTILKFIIEVTDNDGASFGSKSETELTLRVKSVGKAKGSRPPVLDMTNLHDQITVTTREKAGYTVETVEGIDPEGDQLWYEIVSGDPEQFFIMFPDSQNLILARSIPTPRNFRLNISVSDGFNFVFTQLLIQVIESNEDASSLIWEQGNYTVSISESTPPFSVVTTVRLNSTSSSGRAPPLYGFHNAQDVRSLRLFSIDSVSGVVRTMGVGGGEGIDREIIPRHILTIKARDSDTYTFVRLLINILDENDKAPVFGAYSQTEVRVPETMAVGALVTQVFAYDADFGGNGILNYSIVYGNIGNTFEIDAWTGRIFLRRQLSIPPGQTTLEYQLTVRATDSGSPPLSATTTLVIVVTLPSDNHLLSLRCENDVEEGRNSKTEPCSCTVHIQENSLPGTYVTTLHVLNSIAGISFEIEENRNNGFWIDPGTGILLVGTGSVLDREIKALHEFLVKATNAQGVSAACRLRVILDDENDSIPMFTNQLHYEGYIAEDAPLGTLVLESPSKSREGTTTNGPSERNPLVFRSIDYDTGRNAIVSYSFVEDEEMRTIFYMDPSSGALLLVTSLDYEKRQSYNFQVRVCDWQFCDPSPANVTVRVENVNDQEPIVSSAQVELLLPTAVGVTVHVVEAMDADGDELKFSLLNGLDGYEIEGRTGRLLIRDPTKVTLGKHGLEVRVSDGRFIKTGTVTVTVRILETRKDFGFTNLTFETSFVENSTKIGNLLALPVMGTHLNENLQFTILNPSIYFGIMRTSGVVITTGNKLDRESQAEHNLLVEVRGNDEARISRCFVKIAVTDVNDNAPFFLNLPYIAVVLVNAKVGEPVIQVKAQDLDINENGIVRYELVRSPFGDIYELNKQTGEIFFRRQPEVPGQHELIVKVYDLGLPSLHAETQVQIKVVTHDQPVFEHQFYETWLPESAPVQSTALALTATSKHPVFFSIEGGNELDLYGIDYQTGTLFVNAPLDFEATPIHLLKVKAKDLITSSWSSAMVQINLKDSNDEIPKPEKSTFVFHVVEGYMPPRGILGRILTTDKDEGVNALLTYEIEPTAGWLRTRSSRSVDVSSEESAEVDSSTEDLMMSEDATSNNRSVDVSQLFTISPNDGIVILKQMLDYEYAHEYYFSVIVRDSGIPSLSSTTRVVVNVINVNDNAPYFSKPLYMVRLSEDAPMGHTVAKVTAVDLDNLDSLRYNIIGEYHKAIVFDIDKTSGVVTLLQPQVLQSELRFVLNISVTDGVFTSYTRLQISIQPKNHVVPTFELAIYEVLAPENSPEGFLITTLTAQDKDRGIFGQIYYSFSDMDEPNLFQINEKNGQVRLSSVPDDISLDREYKESHTLQVVAQDGGKWIGYTKLVVKVEKRKTSPTFPVSEYRVTIPFEKMKSKTPILQAVAIDSDSEFGIRYGIVDLANGNSTTKRDSQYFEINSENGDLRFKLSEEDLAKFGNLDSTRLDFQFWVRAEDGELHSLVPVMVVVLPDSEPSPEIHPQNATFFLKEDATVGSIVTTFRVSNIESPQFRVVSSNEDLFQVDPNGNLILSALLDQDEEDKHTVVVWAQNSEHGNVATSQVTIRVLATFSNKPKFNQAEYHLSVAEDFPEGSLVFTARAVDSDKGGNIKERYELQSDDPGTDLFHFGINQEHGWITLLNRLDYEKHRQHTLRVVASDSDNPSVTSATTVVINVLNVDDEPSLFDSGVYYTEVREDIREGSIVKVLRTVDLDEQNGNSTITPKYLDFYIVAGDGNSHFKINEQAEVSVWRKLDAEVQDRFELTILATDGKNLDYTNVTIKIIDVNDNVPVCPIPEIFQELSEASPNSTYVTVVEAYDPDKEARPPLFYLSGSGFEKFRIDPESGILSVSGSLDRETKSTYSLTIHARDREEPRSECKINVRINLLDENDNTPVWRYTGGMEDEAPYYKFSLKEDSPIGTFVGKVSGQDADIGINSRLSYSLISALTKGGDLAKDQFEVESRSGVITLLRPLDRELISEYNLTLKVMDGGTPALSTTVPVFVQVLDINDNPPEFLAGSYSVAISELAEVSTEVLTVRATSKDEGVNAEIRYDIVGGNGYFHWVVDPKSGVISINASLDYERIREYILTVRARDGPPDNQLASQCTVNISVIDENDNSPQFSHESYSASIPEDLSVSSSVIQIVAADLDNGLNAELKYQLGYGDPMNSFRIHPSTGTIFVASILDREMIPYYTLEIIATDHGTPPKSSSAKVEIQILDVNDSPPLFSKENYTAIVQEDRLVGFKVVTFEVSDADSTPNSTPFSWDLKSLDEEEKGELLPFTVTDAGFLIVSGKLNFLRKNMYKLQVKVFDNGTPPLESKANVSIQVVDKSQWPPVISSLSVTAVTLEDTYPPGILGVCHASDFDSFDVLTYSLLTTKSSSFFTIDHLNGTLYNLIPLREGTYELGVVVSDGRWSARNDAYVKVISLANPFPDIQKDQLGDDEKIHSAQRARNTKEMNHFLLVSISGHNRQSLLNRMSAFKNVIKEAVSLDTVGKVSYEVVILSVQSSVDGGTASETGDEGLGGSNRREKRESPQIIPGVDLLLSVKRSSDGRFMETGDLVKQLRFALPQIEGILSAKVTRITANICKNNSCDRGTCRTIAIFEGTQSLITTETLSLITPNHILETVCSCPVGYGGPRCGKVINACAHSECAAGLVCVPDESVQGYACLCAKLNCSEGSGACEDQCSHQSVSFTGTSLLSYNVGPSLERELSISLRIKTLYTSGTLLYSASEFDYAVLEINQGLVQFSWDLGTGKEVLTVTSISVSDNRWHQILLQLRDSYAILRVNERSTQRQKSQGPARILHTNGIFHIGSKLIGSYGNPIENQIPSQGFIGCMKNLRFGFISDGNKEKAADLFQTTQTQEVKHYINTPGRTGMGMDSEVGQVNGGSGTEQKTNDEESQPDPSNFRMNPLPLHVTHLESSQFKLIFSRNISFSCAKVIHFVEACRSLPCKNGGTCYADSTPNGYACKCHPRFHGLNCEIDLEPCGSSPCLNGGKCRPTSNEISFSPSLSGNEHSESQFYCQCVDDGTHGSRCQSGKYCKNSENLGESEVCNHRGECEDGPNGAICWCESGYTGNRCQFDYDECKEGGEKVCGPGSKCVNFLGGFRCLCPSNASGVYCQKVLTTPSIVTNDYQIIALIFIIVLTFIVLLLIFVCVRRCCTKRGRGGASNSIPLTTSQVKVQGNRINGDNREQVMRNRDSKISNLEVRPVSGSSETFQTERVPLDGIKNYGPGGDEVDKPQFINNLMKPPGGEKKRVGPPPPWDTNRDDYPKIQNYIKGEISWGSKGSKPNSPDSGEGSGYHWEGYHGDPHAHPANISPIRTLPPPPPDLPDSLSIVSHDSNNEVLPINLSLTAKNLEGLTEGIEFSDYGEDDTSGTGEMDNKWPIPHPDAYLLPHNRYSEDEQEATKPIILRNRYQEKPGGSHQTYKEPPTSHRRHLNEDEINENCSLLCGTPFPAQQQPHPIDPPELGNEKSPSAHTSANSSPRKRFSSSSIFPMKPNGRNSSNQKHNYSKTTHVTEV